MSEPSVPRPFLKWAGGKSQLVDALSSRRPVNFLNYHEPFVGGGALFFKLVRIGKIQHAYISDLNAELIDTYIAIRDHVDEVINNISHYPHDRDFYYELRSKDPRTLDLPERASRMIYLNKTGFNGLYRVNRDGKFNVPFGRYKSPKYFDQQNLLEVSQALKGVTISCASFEIVLDFAGSGDFVYFDPPYVPLTSTANFTAYQSGGFSIEHQQRLRDVCIELTSRNVLILLSNSDTSAVRDLYSSSHFDITEVRANRAINCKGGGRGKLTELMVTNYQRQLDKEITARLFD